MGPAGPVLETGTGRLACRDATVLLVQPPGRQCSESAEHAANPCQAHRSDAGSAALPVTLEPTAALPLELTGEQHLEPKLPAINLDLAVCIPPTPTTNHPPRAANNPQTTRLAVVPRPIHNNTADSYLS